MLTKEEIIDGLLEVQRELTEHMGVKVEETRESLSDVYDKLYTLNALTKVLNLSLSDAGTFVNFLSSLIVGAASAWEKEGVDFYKAYLAYQSHFVVRMDIKRLNSRQGDQ